MAARRSAGHGEPWLVAVGDVREHKREGSSPRAPPPLPALGVVAALHRAVVATVGEVFIAAALEVELPERRVVLRPPAGVRRLLWRESTPDVGDGILVFYAIQDGRNGYATGEEVPPS